MTALLITSFRTNKIDAARRQLEAAIRMFFRNEDSLAVHTVNAAAFSVLRGLAKKFGKCTIHELFRTMIRSGKEKEVWSAINKVANFLKHSDHDSDEILEGIKEEINDLAIVHSCLYYEGLGFQMTPTMGAFMQWFMIVYPDFIEDNVPAKQEVSSSHFQNVRAMSRLDQVNYGLQILSVMQKRIA